MTCWSASAGSGNRTVVRNSWPHVSQLHQWRTKSWFTCCERAGATIKSSHRGQCERTNLSARAENVDMAGYFNFMSEYSLAIPILHDYRRAPLLGVNKAGE
jgi:hypothetical protein